MLFDLISARAGWLAQRQAVLGQNVANADTPGFRPLDLAPASFERLLQEGGRLDLLRTSLGHVTDAPGLCGTVPRPGGRLLRDRPLG